jgi:CheY-like chemotaxis protein
MDRLHYSYQEAENGLKALEAYRNGTSQFKIILMDMSMPISKSEAPLFQSDGLILHAVDGMTSTRAIRQYEKSKQLPRCRIVALTGIASASARLEALSSGIDYFMTKPMNFRALESLLKDKEEEKQTHHEPLISKNLVKTEKNTEAEATGESIDLDDNPQQEASSVEKDNAATKAEVQYDLGTLKTSRPTSLEKDPQLEASIVEKEKTAAEVETQQKMECV